jgi:LPS export ABC transporter protein LptC
MKIFKSSRMQSATFWLGSLVATLIVSFLCYYSAIHWFKNNSERYLQTVSTPQWFATGIAVTKMSEEGTPYQQLFAGEMRHFAERNTTQLINIRLNVFSEPQTPWQLTAKQGEALHSTDKLEEIKSIDLIQNVVLQKDASAKSGSSKMLTEFLRIFPDTRKVETDKRVDITQPGNHVSAIGMDADFNKNTIILRKQVKSEHEPNQQPTM